MLNHAQDPIATKQFDFLYHGNQYYDYSDNDKLYTDQSAQIDQRPSEHGKCVSESTYWELYYEDPDINYEWNNGILEEKEMPNSFSDLCKHWLETIINHFLNFNPIARQIKSELAFTINLKDKTTIRKPDFSLILKSNPIQLNDFDCSYKGIYDLCVEYLSDSKDEYIKRDTVDKKDEYCAGKVKEYFIIDSKQKHTAFYRLVKKQNRYYYEKINPKNGIIKSQVLPGFQFRLNDLYLHPNPEELYKDDVYKSYVKVDLQNEKKSKDEAIKKMEMEKKSKDEAIKKMEMERKAKEIERKAKEQALRAVAQERKAKEEALKEIERLKNIL